MLTKDQIETKLIRAEKFRSFHMEPSAVTVLVDYLNEFAAEIKRLQADNDRLRKALGVFGDKESWCITFRFDDDGRHVWRLDESPLQIARRALEGDE